MCTYRIELTYQSWHNSAANEDYGKEKCKRTGAGY